MLLKNFSYGLVSLFLKAGTTNTQKYFKGTQGQAVGVDNGTQMSRTTYALTSSVFYNGTSENMSNSSNIFFSAAYGTGNTPPTIDDYQLSGDLVSDLGVTNAANNVNANGITFSHSITNLGNTSVTIKEIALCVSYNIQASPACVMLTRDVLAEPIVLEPNEQRNVSIFIDSNSFVQEVA